MTHMDIDDPIGRRREKRARQARTRLLVFGALAGVVLAGAAATVAALVVTGKTGVVAVDRPAWTHKELAEHLKAKGVPVAVEGGGWAADGEASSLLVEPGTGVKVGCLLTATDQRAREFAASRGEEAFAWGRFAVFGGGQKAKAFRDRIRAALD